MGVEDCMSEFIGIDVSKSRLDVRLHGAGESISVENDEDGLARLKARLKLIELELIVMEASGGYERLAAAVLTEAGFAVAVANPRQVSAFDPAAGVLAKTHRAAAGAHVRSGLYMAVVSAIRGNTAISGFYKRLRAAGKPGKVALTACMHKMLTILNAMMRTQTRWHEPQLR